jgi:hypothetical protein
VLPLTYKRSSFRETLRALATKILEQITTSYELENADREVGVLLCDEVCDEVCAVTNLPEHKA